MKNIAEWILEEKNKNNPYALDTFSDFAAKGVTRLDTFSKRCDMFTEVYGVGITDGQKQKLYRWLCDRYYCGGITYQKMINTLIELM